jgi:hypothetical protein
MAEANQRRRRRRWTWIVGIGCITALVVGLPMSLWFRVHRIDGPHRVRIVGGSGDEIASGVLTVEVRTVTWHLSPRIPFLSAASGTISTSGELVYTEQGKYLIGDLTGETGEQERAPQFVVSYYDGSDSLLLTTGGTGRVDLYIRAQRSEQGFHGALTQMVQVAGGIHGEWAAANQERQLAGVDIEIR